MAKANTQPVVTTSSAVEPKHNDSQTAKAIKAAASAVEKTKPVLNPAQVLTNFAEQLKNKTEVLTLGQDIMEAFSHESESKIEVGRLLDKAQSALTENWANFRDKFLVASLRKSTQTIANYIAMYRAFVLTFDRASVEFRHALRRIWSAEGCFDLVSGELNSTVTEAIAACGGIKALEKATSAEVAAHLARKFVDTCDAIARSKRKRENGKAWTSKVIKAKLESIVRSVKTFVNKVSESRCNEMAGTTIQTAINAVDNPKRKASLLYSIYFAMLETTEIGTLQDICEKAETAYVKRTPSEQEEMEDADAEVA